MSCSHNQVVCGPWWNQINFEIIDSPFSKNATGGSECNYFKKRVHFLTECWFIRHRWIVLDELYTSSFGSFGIGRSVWPKNHEKWATEVEAPSSVGHLIAKFAAERLSLSNFVQKNVNRAHQGLSNGLFTCWICITKSEIFFNIKIPALCYDQRNASNDFLKNKKLLFIDDVSFFEE